LELPKGVNKTVQSNAQKIIFGGVLAIYISHLYFIWMIFPAIFTSMDRGRFSQLPPG
jgi:hypothetical protein